MTYKFKPDWFKFGGLNRLVLAHQIGTDYTFVCGERASRRVNIKVMNSIHQHSLINFAFTCQSRLVIIEEFLMLRFPHKRFK